MQTELQQRHEDAMQRAAQQHEAAMQQAYEIHEQEMLQAAQQHSSEVASLQQEIQYRDQSLAELERRLAGALERAGEDAQQAEVGRASTSLASCVLHYVPSLRA